MSNFEEQLMAAVRENEVLYNKSKAGYKNTHMKAAIWREIATKLNSTDDICVKRWRSLRDRFVRETKKLHAPSGSAYIPPINWELYDSLKFLNDYLMPRKTQGTHRKPLEPEVGIDTTNESFGEVNDSHLDCELFSPNSRSSQSKGSAAPRNKKKNIAKVTK